MSTVDMKSGIEGIGSIKENYEKYKDMFTTEQNDLITMDSFYSLLVAEMQNQDPLEPTSNTEWISQMASFTGLQAQQDSYKTQINNYAASLVGRTVTVSTDLGKLETGVVSYVTSGEDPKINIDGKSYSLDAIQQVSSGSGTQQANKSDEVATYGAFATSLIGKKVTVQFTAEDNNLYIDEGKVDSVEIQDGEVRLVINGYAYKVTDVVSIKEDVNASVSNNTANENEELLKLFE